MLNLDRFAERMEAARERRLSRPSEAEEPHTGILRPGVFMEAHWYGWSGYAKATREIGLRMAHSLHVEPIDAVPQGWGDYPEKARVNALRRFGVAADVPRLRFCGPNSRPRDARFSICYTMMETELIHPDMVELLNGNFDEVWTPTAWNRAAFLKSGVGKPIRVMPLGSDPLVYRPRPRTELPPCELYSTARVGEMEVPRGFLFISVGLPSLRKGFDVLIAAFEDAFGEDPDAALVCAVTGAGQNTITFHPDSSIRSRVYALQGEMDEHGMARLYSSCDAYVSASRGEGWNLPACEAALTGLPVILPRNTAHPDVFGPEEACFFDPEGYGLFPGADHVSPWYVGMPFSIFGKRSHEQLVSILREVRARGKSVGEMAARGRARILRDWGWDKAASRTATRLLELQ